MSLDLSFGQYTSMSVMCTVHFAINIICPQYSESLKVTFSVPLFDEIPIFVLRITHLHVSLL